ncbi:MAG: SDR family NAD(P)-dependent oxidoreductase [Rubritepida sp.]|nr:SDR family NAD(P)-dependent oxidoreductase [Rubritepida sp.]MCU0943743.1 SDR family NAD(P)-dependent oxidoreductase [Rubritepida sp.]
MSVVITGASRGLGAALAREFAGPGVALRLIARDAAALAAVAADCAARGATVETALCDVREAARLAAILEAWDDAAPVTLLIANAGITGGTPPDGGLEGWEGATRVLGVNLLGAVNTVEPLLPRMLARRAGRVALIASVAAFRALPDAPAYSASKAGLWSYGEALRARLGPRGVGVSLVAPGFFASALSARFQGPHPGEVSAEAMARRVARGLRRGRARVVAPWSLGALLRGLELLPAPLADRAARVLRFTIRAD